MNRTQPVYTVDAECRDCYKCVRNCPVKAIKIENSVASVIDELCILCGNCVKACPGGAKKVRNDLKRVRKLLRGESKVYLSIAPSYINEFPDTPPSILIDRMKMRGFEGVSETALGAEEVSSHVAESFKNGAKGIVISSACPVVVEYITKYAPDIIENISPLLSPALAHARLMKKWFGDDIEIVFAGPCIGKKRESDDFSDLISASLTFEELRQLLDEVKEGEADVTAEFIPRPAEEGGLYPVEGGMTAGISRQCGVVDNRFMSVSGMDSIKDALANLDSGRIEGPLFIEMLACSGGCSAGPFINESDSLIFRRNEIIKKYNLKNYLYPKASEENIERVFTSADKMPDIISDDAVEQVLKDTGKNSLNEEKNCGGCGYSCCRSFAEAVVEGKAETDMCVTYMRQRAHKKANRLMAAMPSGVVIVDNNLKIVECNRNFATMIGGDAEMIFNAKPGMEGASLDKLIDFTNLFRWVLDSGRDIENKDIRSGNLRVRCSIFSIDPKRIVGGVFQDITEPSVKREEIIDKTREVIHKNLQTVQKIAYLLGENASETELTLNSVIESFIPEEVE